MRALVACLVVVALAGCSRREAPEVRATSAEPPVATMEAHAPAPAPRPTPPVAEVVPAKAPPAGPVRDHRLFTPLPSPGPHPLLVILHGYGTDADRVAQALDAKSLARRHGMLVALPNGTADKTGRQAWNATDACCDFDGREVDDVAAIRQLIDHLAAKHEVDPRRIYLAGYSNGAFMAHRLACELDDRLAAVATLSGVGYLDDAHCAAREPVALLHVHGDADTIVRYEGGQVLHRAHLPRHPGAEQTVAHWAARNGCAAPTQSRDELAGMPNHRRRFEGCRQPVELWRVEGGGHVIGTDRSSVERIVAFLLAQRRTTS